MYNLVKKPGTAIQKGRTGMKIYGTTNRSSFTIILFFSK